jgi:hypothetical protein
VAYLRKETPTVEEANLSVTAPSPAQSPRQPQGEEADKRGPLAKVVSILVVERARVAARILLGRITFRAPGAAAALTLPEHGLPFTPEAESMPDQAAANHATRGYPTGHLA